ncbi:MAG: MBL fold metallo-hydrolase [Rhodoferax sp.]|uniref:MBL fold metallo-hydrolase n=1 Tax=Rhodoferax sp. TaxID=50421 RepID=UPI003016CBEB
MPSRPMLPNGISVLERGWLSSNSILMVGRDSAALIDSGYGLHADQTLLLIQSTLQGRPLDVLLNTHLHSDHCGGNAALQNAFPKLLTHIPPGLSLHVQDWDPHALTYSPTGQSCPRFGFDAVLRPGTEIQLGDRLWQIHAAPGHDTHSVILFEPESRVLVSADALWERGFGVVFPELEGDDAFAAVSDTLDLIESLRPAIVIPGHGSAFTCVDQSLAFARQRLSGFVANPIKHLTYGAKVLLKFKLLEAQSIALTDFMAWTAATPYLPMIHASHFSAIEFAPWIEQLIQDLVRSGAASRQGADLRNA